MFSSTKRWCIARIATVLGGDTSLLLPSYVFIDGQVGKSSYVGREFGNIGLDL